MKTNFREAQEEHTRCCQWGRKALVTSSKVSSSTNIQGKLTHLGVSQFRDQPHRCDGASVHLHKSQTPLLNHRGLEMCSWTRGTTSVLNPFWFLLVVRLHVTAGKAQLCQRRLGATRSHPRHVWLQLGGTGKESTPSLVIIPQTRRVSKVCVLPRALLPGLCVQKAACQCLPGEIFLPPLALPKLEHTALQQRHSDSAPRKSPALAAREAEWA